jgi:hypothetical protein
MKLLSITLFLLSFASFSTFATDRNYSCLASTLQSLNSDIYYNLSDAQIDAMLTIPEMAGHLDALNAAKQCSETKVYCNGNLEAQFIGTVLNFKQTPQIGKTPASATFQVGNIRFFQENQLCPLDESMTFSARLFVWGNSSLKNGDEISGVLVFNPNTNQFTIE